MGYVVYDEKDRIGDVGVDSGQIMLTDPCYVQKGQAYKKLLSESSQNDGKVLKGAAVIVGVGDDGLYPAYLARDGRRRIIVIDLAPENDDEDCPTCGGTGKCQ